VLGGDRAGEGWAREKELTGGVGLSVREVRAREREGRGADGRGQAVIGREWRAVWAAWAGRRGEGGGCARAGLEAGPAEGGKGKIPFSFLFLILSFFFSTF
jgi:hypothetical protein